jgi:hypothetical protein
MSSRTGEPMSLPIFWGAVYIYNKPADSTRRIPSPHIPAAVFFAHYVYARACGPYIRQHLFSLGETHLTWLDLARLGMCSAWLGSAWLGLANFTGGTSAWVLFSRNFRKSEMQRNFFLALQELACIVANTDWQFCLSLTNN